MIRVGAAVALFLLTLTSAYAQERTSPGNANYTIDVRLDARARTLTGRETLVWTNITTATARELQLHLYYNAWRNNQSTFMKEARLAGGWSTVTELENDQLAKIDVSSIKVRGGSDLTDAMRFIAPDDGNKDDKTVVDVHLPKAVAPGSFVQFKIAFQTRLPETQARSGWKRDFTLGGQWFPKVGVWWNGAWNCHQYHATTEFFADFGVYDVKLTVPQYEVIGASGVEVSNVNNPDSTKTVTYHGDDIHDFAWTVSPRYKVQDDGVFQGQMGPVKMRILMQPANFPACFIPASQTK